MGDLPVSVPHTHPCGLLHSLEVRTHSAPVRSGIKAATVCITYNNTQAQFSVAAEPNDHRLGGLTPLELIILCS